MYACAAVIFVNMTSQDIYSHPETDYQKFVNAYRAKNPYYERKEIVKKSGVLWSEIKGDARKVAKYIASAPIWLYGSMVQ